MNKSLRATPAGSLLVLRWRDRIQVSGRVYRIDMNDGGMASLTPLYDRTEEAVTDKEALDALAQMFNEEPSDQELEAVGIGLEKMREIVRSTGREVAANRAEPVDPEPPSGY